MSFDTATRNRLASFVARCRRLLCGDFNSPGGDMAARLAHYGIQPSGQIAPLESLAHLDEGGLEMARLLRDLLAHKRARSPEAKVWKAFDGAVYDLLQEQGFTALNRLCALRMAEERKLIVQCVGKGQQSEGFELFEYHTGKSDESCSVEVRYQQFLYAFFDELALDLGALFARYSPQGLLFPSPQALAALLAEINHPELAPLWAEDETIGWIYQYWNSQEERKAMRDASAAPRNSRELAVRNQFFTPRYVVEFLTDNTLGRIWYEMMQGRTVLKEQCRYLVRRPNEIFLAPGESAPETPVADNLSQEELLRQPVHIPHRPLKDPREIRLLDPACGSMHFGLYAFDLFEAIYAEAWDLAERSKAEGGANTPQFLSFGRLVASFPSKAAFLRQVPRLIIEHNIHGIDIDPRAAQVAGLSLWLRAQRTWYLQNVPAPERPAIRRSNIVCAEPMPGEKELLREFVEQTFPLEERPIFQRLLEAVFEKMQLAGEAGSLLKIEEEILTAISEARTRWKAGPRLTQGLLFGGGGPTTAQDELDLSGVTDELFWDRVEDRIYAALGEYAAKAENSSLQRRLFAEDAAKGFAFIEVCRKRYDAVVMNPPFGQFSKLWKEASVLIYPNSYNDILGAFVDCFVNRLQMRGLLGAITSRTCFFLTSFKNWREKVILTDAALTAVADLGQGVMDNAMVEAAAYVIERKLPEAIIPFMRAVAEHDKQVVVNACIRAYKEGTGERRLLLARQETFRKLPDFPFVYWVVPEDLEKFAHHQQFEPEIGFARQGLATGDDSRFCRAVWEVAPQDTQFVYYPTNGESSCRLDDPTVVAYYRRKNAGTPIWAFHVKAGASQPWYSPITLKINWNENGAELRNFTDTKGKLRSRPQNVAFYYRPGFSWTRRAVRFFPYIIPSSCIPSVSRYMAFPTQGREFEALGVCAARVTSAFMRFYAEFWQRPNFLVDNVKMLPWPTLDDNSQTFFRELAVSEVKKRRTAYQNHEPFHEFLVPIRIIDFSADGNALSFDATSLLGESGESIVTQAYGLEANASIRIERDLVEAISFQQSGGNSDSQESDDDDDSDFVLDFSEQAQAEALLSYLIGGTLGRWDIRYATGERHPPELPDPFAPLPVCPPGMLQNAAGLPAGPGDVPAEYPVKDIPWDGILVDDPEHPLDIERRIREVIEIIWTGQNGAPNAAAIEAEACELLEVRSLREYFRKPAGFFADHLKRYSKSRRKAPIYWPLSTPSGGYTIWLYYHRLNEGTLYKVVEQFVEPKQGEVQATFQTLAAKESRSRAEDRELENAQTLLGELAAFRDDLLRLAKIWKPNLNDGVVITAAPLWRHFRLPAWQKELRTTWESLERGEYDWAHLAYSLWPERVTEKCKTDRSVAIAHKLERLCTIEPPKPKKKRVKAKVEEEAEML